MVCGYTAVLFNDFQLKRGSRINVNSLTSSDHLHLTHVSSAVMLKCNTIPLLFQRHYEKEEEDYFSALPDTM